MADHAERRKNHALRRRIDQLIDRVRASREEIVERGLDAVHKPAPVDGAATEPDASGDGDRGAEPR